MKHLLHTRHAQICAALIAADCLVFTMVNPRSASAHWLIIGYVLLGLTLFGLSSLIATSLRNYGDVLYAKSRRLLRYGVSILVGVIGLQSIGQLSVKDVSVLLPFVVLAYLYFGYGKKMARENA